MRLYAIILYYLYELVLLLFKVSDKSTVTCVIFIVSG
jgi:hypothetical protein